MILTSRQNPKIKYLKSLQQSKYRKQSQQFLINGYHIVEEALKIPGIVQEIFEVEGFAKFPNSTLISNDLVPYLSEQKSPQNIFALCNFKTNDQFKINKAIVLDNLQDPGNIGTIIRLAKAFDFDTIILNNVDIYNDKVIRSSQGALFSVNIFCTDNLELLLNNLKQKKGFLIYQTLLSKNAKKINDVQFRQNNIAFVFGNEGNGISQNIQKLSDCDLYIPINFESLNVACACAIVLNKVFNG